MNPYFVFALLVSSFALNSHAEEAVVEAAAEAAPTAEIAGDATLGAKIFNRCKACHTTLKGQPNRTGPNLWGITGKGIAELEGFKYSPAFLEKKGEIVWDDATLAAYLENPRVFIPKSRMIFAGLKTPEQRANIIAYLHTLKDADDE